MRRGWDLRGWLNDALIDGVQLLTLRAGWGVCVVSYHRLVSNKRVNLTPLHSLSLSLSLSLAPLDLFLSYTLG